MIKGHRHPLGELARHVFERMDGAIDLTGTECLFDLLDEQAFAPERGKRRIANAVARRADDDELAVDAIAEVGPGGHHFGTSHTLQRYESAFYAPLLSNRQNFEAWKEAGSIDIAGRANTMWKQLLNEYEQPPLDPAIDEELVSYVTRRKKTLSAA